MNTIWIPDLSAEVGPKYLALTQALRRAVAAGELAAGARLPPVRALAWRLSMTPGTVARAYQLATQEGLLEATVGRGTFVAARGASLPPLRAAPAPGLVDPPFGVEPPPRSDLLDMRSPRLAEVGQIAAFSQALQRVGAQVGADWLTYTRQDQEAPLRAAVCDWLSDRDLGPLDPAQVMLTLGGQSAIALVMSACLWGERPVVLVEDLAFPGFRYAARLARAEVVPVGMDGEGLCPDALEAACRQHHPQLLCLMPEAQNPTGARMGLDRRRQIVAVAQRHNLQIVEDECYAPATSPHPALRSLAPERVWYVGSFSKTISASLRFGYVICPVGQGEAARRVVEHSYYALPHPLSALCLDLFASGAARDIRRAVQAEIALRLSMVVDRLGAYGPGWQPGVPFVWLPLPQGWRASSFARCAEDAGVLLRSADQYALVSSRVPPAVRMALPCDVGVGALQAGLDGLARLLPNPPSDMAA